MPELTPRLGIKKPFGNESVSRQGMNENWDIIDSSVAKKADLDTHTANTNNPHDMKPDQIGAETPSGAQAKADVVQNNLNTHTTATSAHGATSAATPNRQIIRDGNGRAKVAAPSASDDIATKGTVDAVQANIDSATTRISNLESKQVNYASAYDVYYMDMSLYYTGHFSGPDIVGMRTMTFDGFIDTARVDTVNTTAEVDTNNKVVKAQRTFSGTSTNLYSQTSEDGGSNNASGSGISSSFITGSNKTKMDKVTFKVTSVSGSVNITATIRTGGPYGTVIATAPVVTISTTGLVDFNFSGTNLVLEPNTTYYINLQGGSVYFSGYGTNPGQGLFSWENGNQYNFLNYMVVKAFPPNGYQTNNKLVSTTKTLMFIPQKAKLYITYKNATNTNIVPKVSINGGTNYESMTQLTTRTDPKDSAYTEREYEVTFANTGTSLKLQVDITSTDGLNTVEIKRYGIQLA